MVIVDGSKIWDESSGNRRFVQYLEPRSFEMSRGCTSEYAHAAISKDWNRQMPRLRPINS